MSNSNPQAQAASGKSPVQLLTPLLIASWLLASWLLLHSYQASVSNFRDAALQQSQEHTQALLELQKSLVNAKLLEMQRILETISHLATRSEMDTERLQEAFQARKQPSPEILALMLLDAQGQLLAFSRPDEAPDLSDREYFTWHQEQPTAGEFYLSHPLKARNPEQHPFIAMSTALTNNDGELQQVLAMALDLKMLAEALNGLVSANGHTMVLAHQEGDIYFRMPWLEEALGQESPVIREHQGPIETSHATRITSPFDQQTRQIAYGRVESTPLVVFISESLEPTLASIDRYEREQAWRWGLAFLVATLLFISLTSLIRLRQKSLQQLLDSEERYRLAKEAANIGVWDLNLKTGALNWDLQVWMQLGYSTPGFPLSHEAWLNTIHPEDLKQVLSTTSEKIRLGQPFEIEYRSKTRQGHWQWQQGKGQVVAWDSQGQPLRVLGTSQTIQDRKQTEDRLQSQAEALKASNAELEQFAYVASHDLRQPLRMIRSYIDLLNKRLSGQLNDEARQFMAYISDGAERMDSMLTSLLEYSRVGRKGEPVSQHSLRQLAEEALTYLQPEIQATQAQIEFSGNWPEQLLISRNEGVRLFQNLLSNALKYQPRGQQPRIQLHAQELEHTWQFAIQDNGIGIDPEQQDRLFKVFQRLHSRQEYEGTGIGLAICRKIVERHGGETWLESQGQGQGSCFYFTLAKAVD